MADDGRDVTLKIKVDDAQVKQAEASLNRLNDAANKLDTKSLTQDQKLAYWQKYGAGWEDKVRGLQQVATQTEAVTAASEGMAEGTAAATSGLSGLAAAGGVVTIAVAAIAVALIAAAAIAVELAHKVFDLAKAFAEYGMEVGKAMEATGLAAETVSALRHEADRVGISFGQVESAMDSFRKTIGEAAAGSEDARKKLVSLGVDGKAAIYNVDAAFKQAAASIANAPTQIDQVRLAVAAFGDDGYKLLPFLKDFQGDTDGLIKKMEELGLVLSDGDVKASKEFNKSLEDMRAALKSLEYTFGREFLPTVTQALKDITSFLHENKDAILDWAKWTAAEVKGVIDWWEKAAKAVGDYNARHAEAAKFDSENIFPNSANNYPLPIQSNQTPLTTAVPVAPGATGEQLRDPAALKAMMDEQEKLLEKALEDQKKTVAAKIESWQIYVRGQADVLKRTVKSLEDDFARTGDQNAFRQAVTSMKDWYLGIVNKTYTALEALEDKQDQLDKKNDAEVALRQQQQAARRKELAQAGYDAEREMNEKIAAAGKKLTADQLREAEEAMRKRIELFDLRESSGMEAHAYALKTLQITDQQYLDFQKKSDLDTLEYRKKQIADFLAKYQVDSKKRAELDGETAKLDQAIADQRTRNEQTLTPLAEARIQIVRDIAKLERDNADVTEVAARRKAVADAERLSIEQQITALQDNIANGGVNDALAVEAAHLQDIIDLRNRELDAVIRINRAQLELSKSMQISNNQIRAGVYEHLAAQKTLNESIVDGINGTYDAITKQMDTQLDKLNTWSKGLLSFITEPLKAIQHNAVSGIFKNIVDNVFPGTGLGDQLTKTGNPVARPIVDKLDETNKILTRIANGAGGASAGSTAGIGGGLGGIIANFSPFLRGGTGTGPGGTPYFNGNASGGGSSNIVSELEKTLAGDSGPGAPGSPEASRGIIGKIFGKGGIFGKDGFGLNQGTFSGIGAIANVVGGLVGGQVGNIISLAGTGASIGFTVGGPIGAAIGAGIGALIGIFGGDPKKKQDQQQNIPQLTQGFSDAMTQLTKILADIRSLNGDPDALLTQAQTIRSQIASGFGVQFGSKWGQKQSATLIAQELAAIDRQPDGLMAQIIAAAAIARGAADRSKRILPEFAGGNYFADFFRPNGLIPGAFDGADNILAMISRGEAVLNPSQMARARAAAGFDVFAHAGIPNYPHTSPGSKYAAGGLVAGGLSAQPIVVQPVFTLELSGVSLDDKVEAYLTSDSGVRTQINVQKKLKKSGDI